MQIGTLASATGLSRDTLRFYEERGLIRAERSSNGYRVYAQETVQMVGYIRTAQKLGFSLHEIGDNLPALWDSPNPDQAVASLLADKVAVIDRKIAELNALRQELLERVPASCPMAQAPGSRSS
ncbi:MerR family transcriptional regulator [Variovorax sp. ZS18.2.2]|uniref:MerR family transcriptional regulator n=1 Tax=Variovorax sp. ZS18.2.2 TaxID=2971255 RepID=UPI002150E7FF|nr:MerR family transcriptional regulator [Variovorax sp. ZS18.2.2]MCR6478882.1 MerR family transcriptional regulator [Variovorax sp. ZS18.2.2]